MTRGQPFTTRPELAGTHAMVASSHRLASHSGMAVLEADDNAFDAAVAPFWLEQGPEAVDAPTWHTTHLISSFEPREIEIGALHTIAARGDGMLRGAATPRGTQAYAVGR